MKILLKFSRLEMETKNVKEEQIKNDWMLAAAVLDRICAFAFAIIFVVGTVHFIAINTTHHGYVLSSLKRLWLR